MLQPPLFSTDYAGGFGTLYTAQYRADPPQLTYHWPGVSWERRLDDPSDQVEVTLAD